MYKIALIYIYYHANLASPPGDIINENSIIGITIKSIERCVETKNI
jgi:hypothetical protein